MSPECEHRRREEDGVIDGHMVHRVEKACCEWMDVPAISSREMHVQLGLDPAADSSIAQVAGHEGVHGHGKRGALEGPLDVGVVYVSRDLGQSGRFVKMAVAVDHGHVEEPATLRLFSGV